IFVLRDSISPGQLVPGLKITEDHIEVDRLMKTNIEGCFAAGDCTGRPYQYMKAAGEGNVAALSAVAYLDSKK
ncbi:FAD-dependent oxidoreductase, partial [Clostridium perfringens]